MNTERYVTKLWKFVEFAGMLCTLSTCKRAQCGAIIVPYDLTGIYALGYNGAPRNLPNDFCQGTVGNCGCVHAESNALIKFSPSNAKPSIFISTTMPCPTCAAQIINTDSIIGVLYDHAYRIDTRDLLDAGNLLVGRMDDEDIQKWWDAGTTRR